MCFQGIFVGHNSMCKLIFGNLGLFLAYSSVIKKLNIICQAYSWLRFGYPWKRNFSPILCLNLKSFFTISGSGASLDKSVSSEFRIYSALLHTLSTYMESER